MRIAIYARCSTADQSVDLQLDGLRDYAEARGFEVVEEYIDEGVSGVKVKRPALDRLLADAHRRRFDALLVWKLDRLGRSLSHLIRVVEQLVHSASISCLWATPASTRPLRTASSSSPLWGRSPSSSET